MSTMRSENDILEEIRILKKKEEESIEKLKNIHEESDSIGDLITITVLSSILSFTTWLLGESDLRFSTLMEIEEVSRKSIMAGAPVEGVVEFATQKIKELGEKKN